MALQVLTSAFQDDDYPYNFVDDDDEICYTSYAMILQCISVTIVIQYRKYFDIVLKTKNNTMPEISIKI